MWVIATLAGLLGLVILALCVPLYATFNIDTSAKPWFRLRLTWFFGLISKELTGEREKATGEKATGEKAAGEKPEKKKRGLEPGTIREILRTRGLLKRIKELVRSVLGQFKFRELAADIRLGLDNPADTGLLFSIIGPAKALLNLPARYRINIQPSFADEPSFEGYLQSTVRLRPIKPIGSALRFIFSPATLRAAKTLVLSKWKRKR